MQKVMEHEGRVVDVVESRIDVEMIVSGACASCKAKSACSMSESECKIVSVCVDNVSEFSVGDKVVVSITRAMGVKAVVYSYILPFLFMLATLLIMVSIQDNEVVSGCSSLGVLVVYYVVLYFFRQKLSKEIVFDIRKE